MFLLFLPPLASYPVYFLVARIVRAIPFVCSADLLPCCGLRRVMVTHHSRVSEQCDEHSASTLLGTESKVILVLKL